jgi:small subunit ribosomal protein S34
MWWTPIRRSRTAKSLGLSCSIQNLLPNKLPPSLSTRPGNLYQVISRAPGGGVGKKVHQIRWSEKQIPHSYWVVTRAKFKCEGKHGKAWGKLYWRGMFPGLFIHRLSGSVNGSRQTCQHQRRANTGRTKVRMDGGFFYSEDECMTYHPCLLLCSLSAFSDLVLPSPLKIHDAAIAYFCRTKATALLVALHIYLQIVYMLSRLGSVESIRLRWTTSSFCKLDRKCLSYRRRHRSM